MEKRGKLTKDKNCPNCGKLIQRRSNMCNSCAHLGEKHHHWKGGRPKCLDCQKQLKNYYAKRCLSCAGKNKIFSKKHRENLAKALIGKSLIWMKGENNWNWKGGITPINQKLRQSLEYEEWRKKIFERDLYTCQNCGEVGGRLNADHIKLWSFYPELRFSLDNGQTLCEGCHLIKTTMERKNYWKNQYSNFERR